MTISKNPVFLHKCERLYIDQGIWQKTNPWDSIQSLLLEENEEIQNHLEKVHLSSLAGDAFTDWEETWQIFL